MSRPAATVYSITTGPVHWGVFRGGLCLCLKRNGTEFVELIKLLVDILCRVEALGHSVCSAVDLITCREANGFGGGRHSWPQDTFCYVAQSLARHGMWPWTYTRLFADAGAMCDPFHTMVAEEAIVHKYGNLRMYGLCKERVNVGCEHKGNHWGE